MSKFYGSLANRFEEGHNFTGEDIKPGTDITMYLYSDRHPYYVTDVINQKDIKVKEYLYCGDRSKDLDYGHNEWVYFKNLEDYNNYLIKYGLEPTKQEPVEQEWVFRYGKWRHKVVYNLDFWNNVAKVRARGDAADPTNEDVVNSLARWYMRVSDEDFDKIMSGKDVVKYYDLSGSISFGKAEYYYDPSF